MSQRFSWLLPLFLLISAFASATCSLPSGTGVKICTPGDGAFVGSPAQITASAVGKAPITKMAVYVDNERIYFDSGNQLEIVDSNIQEGAHRLTVRAWDSAGNSYSATHTFAVVGDSSAKCIPSTPGVKLCSPANGSLHPVNDFTVVAGALGNNAPITRLKILWGGALIGDTASSSITIQAGGGEPGTQTLIAKAWDAAGNVYSANTTFKTYYSGICSFKGCDPGVVIQSPANHSTVSTSFRLSAEVRKNPAPITAMRAYLDGHSVASSGGPTLSAQITASAGSHRITVQAWDSAGHLYRTTYYVTVQ